MEPSTEEIFNLVGAARYVGVTPATIRYWKLNGLLDCDIINGHWVIRKSALEKADEEAKKRPYAGRRGKRRNLVSRQVA